jgi:hypothetical protein
MSVSLAKKPTARRHLRRLIVRSTVGAAVTIAVAWGCAAWSPLRAVADPFPDLASDGESVPETVDPDGVTGLHYRETGFGWTSMRQSGWRSRGKDGRAIVDRIGPYGGTHHRTAGWPLAALRSRVHVLDSQVASRRYEGEPEVMPTPQRRRWQLPAREIVYRGLATDDLPGWLGARRGRRLPLVPLPGGFVLNTFTYAAAYALAASAVQTTWCRWRRTPRGFTVVGVKNDSHRRSSVPHGSTAQPL